MSRQKRPNLATFPIRVSSKPVQGTSEKRLPPALTAEAASISPAPLPSLPTAPTDKMPPQTGLPMPPPPPHREFNGLPRRPNHANHNCGLPNGTSSGRNLALGTPPLPHHRAAAATRPPDDDIPLEDFISDPLDDPSRATTNGVLAPSPRQANGDSDSDSWLPPASEPFTAPLTRVHFNCYQDHRNMLPASYYWYPVPCMTCLKQDRETRHRCIFCCLRVCDACYGSLQKCNIWSLAELVDLLR